MFKKFHNFCAAPIVGSYFRRIEPGTSGTPL